MRRTRTRRPDRTAPARAAGPGTAPLARHWGWVLAALFTLAFAWRLAYLQRLAGSPMADVMQGDERDYWEWATHLLGNGFRGSNPFYQGPLYPYALALVRAVAGSEPVVVFRCQAALGALAVVLLADAARRLTRPAIALGLGVVLALYEMSVLFDGLVLTESLLFGLEALLVWTWVRAARSGSSVRTAVVLALLTGAIAQGRATGALLLIPGAWIAARTGEGGARSARIRVATLAAVFALTVLPGLLWNWSRTREVIPFTYNLGYNLYVGANPEANGGWVPVTEGDRPAAVPADRADGGVAGDGREYLRRVRHLELTPAASSAWWAAQAADFARREPLVTLALAGRKLLLMWNRSETPQLEYAALFRRFAGPLGLPWVGTFAFLGTLGLAGLLLARGTGPAIPALRMYVLLVTASVLPFFATDRYRFHLVPGVALLGALAVDTAIARARAGGARGLRGPVLAFGAAAVFVALPVRDRDEREDAWRAARDLGMRWLQHGQPARAAREFEHALELQRAFGLDRHPGVTATTARARLDYDYGVALHRLGRDDESLRWLAAAAAEDPDNASYVRTLADAYLVNGREREGDSLLRRVGGLVGGEGEMLISRGWQAARADRMDSAEVYFRRAVSIDDRLFGGWAALIRVQVERRDYAAARASLERARALRMPAPTLLAHEALVDAAVGDSAGARRALAAIPPEALAGDRLLQTVVAIARERLAADR
jgi:tetratricopeptide (TPR) repeat protein